MEVTKFIAKKGNVLGALENECKIKETADHLQEGESF